MLIVLLDAYSGCISSDLSLVSVPHPWPKQVYSHEAVMEMGVAAGVTVVQRLDLWERQAHRRDRVPPLKPETSSPSLCIACS